MEEGKSSPGLRVVAAAVVVLLLGALGLWVVLDERDGTQPTGARNPCAFHDIPVGTYGHEKLRNPPELSSDGGRLKTALDLEYSKKSETLIAGCKVRLRTYEGKLVGPTLRLRPGDTLDLLLRNKLPRESKAQVESDLEQETSQAHLATLPHSFNTTNLHTHGLHVSPRGNGDNVYLAVEPQEEERYEIEIPDDHAPGTFWYHAHGHGSTAIQVGSGAAGTIVIEDDPDEIPPALAAANEREKVMVFQTILYGTNGRIDDIAAFFPDGDKTKKACEDGDSTKCTWEYSKRLTTINGQVVPRIYMRPGEVQRWRLIDSAFREEIKLQLAGHSLHEIALDGLYLGRVDTWRSDQVIDLQPGYRSDVLVKARMKKGTYDLVDVSSPGDRGLREVAEDAQVLAQVVVEGDPVEMDLPTDSEMEPLAPYGDLDLKKEAIDVEHAQFQIGGDLNPDSDEQRAYFMINFFAFDPHRVRKLELGSVAQWQLNAVGAPHVFHIHVNPFQVVRDDPDGNPETVWKDTLAVDPKQDPNGVQVYTRYDDFTGKFVIHCHILDHEDLGMMEAVKVVRGGILADRTGHH